MQTEVILAVRAVAKLDALDFDARVTAVNAFIQQKECEALAAANKRVSNILTKSDIDLDTLSFDETLLQEDAEKALALAMQAKKAETDNSFLSGNYQAGLLALTTLKPAIDDFFDNVMVNAESEQLKRNRLALLLALRNMFMQAADIALLATPSK